MFKSWAKLFVSAAVILMISIQGVSQKPKGASELNFISTKMKRLENYSKDFVAFAQANQNDLDNLTEGERCLNLCDISNRAHERLDSTRVFLFIYYNLSCEVDRKMAQDMIKFEVGYYAKKIESDINSVNIELSIAKKPITTTSGTQLKEDLREIVDFLKSIKY